MGNEALKRAIKKVGSQAALAEKIGTTQSQIWYWLTRAKKPSPPGEFVLPIEQATGGEVTRHELRPDLYPEPSATEVA